MSPRVSRPQFASSLVMQLLLASALLCHLGLVVHGPPAPLPSSRGPSPSHSPGCGTLLQALLQGLEQVRGGSAISVVEGTDSLEKGTGLVPWCVPLAKWGEDGEERKQRRMGGAEAGCGLCFTAAVVQLHGWIAVGRCRVRSLTPSLAQGCCSRVTLSLPAAVGTQSWSQHSRRLNFTMIIGNPKDRKGLEVDPGCPSAFWFRFWTARQIR